MRHMLSMCQMSSALQCLVPLTHRHATPRKLDAYFDSAVLVTHSHSLPSRLLLVRLGIVISTTSTGCCPASRLDHHELARPTWDQLCNAQV